MGKKKRKQITKNNKINSGEKFECKDAARIDSIIKIPGEARAPQVGDFFIVRTSGNVNFTGRVIRVNNSNVVPWVLVYIYVHFASDANMQEIPDKDTSLLMPPFMLSSQCWKDGWVRSVGNRPLSSREMLRRHVFFVREPTFTCDGLTWETIYIDEDENPIKPPSIREMSSPHGIVLMGGLARMLSG